jgi:hypothetical protein
MNKDVDKNSKMSQGKSMITRKPTWLDWVDNLVTMKEQLRKSVKQL